MTLQYSVTLQNNQLAQIQTTVGGSGTLKIYSGTPPANCAATETGTLLASITLPATFMGTPSGASVSLTGTWSGTASATGTAGHFRILDGSAVCHNQGTAGTQVMIPTTAATGAYGNVLTFSSTTGVAVGNSVSGTGILANTTVVSLTSTTVTLSQTSTAGVANGTSITFSPDMILSSTSFTSGQAFSVSTYTVAAGMT